MRTRNCVLACGLGLITAALLCDSQLAQARPLYQTVYQEVYPQESVTRCVLCHTGVDKRKRTDYGKAVEDALGAKNVKDVEAIKAALKKVEGKKPR